MTTSFNSIADAERHIMRTGAIQQLPRGRWRVTVEANGRRFRVYEETRPKALTAAALALCQVFPTRF
jgi:hypothetical protein